MAGLLDFFPRFSVFFPPSSSPAHRIPPLSPNISSCVGTGRTSGPIDVQINPSSGLLGSVGYGACFDLKYSEGARQTNSIASIGRGSSSSGPGKTNRLFFSSTYSGNWQKSDFGFYDVFNSLGHFKTGQWLSQAAILTHYHKETTQSNLLVNHSVTEASINETMSCNNGYSLIAIMVILWLQASDFKEVVMVATHFYRHFFLAFKVTQNIQQS